MTDIRNEILEILKEAYDQRGSNLKTSIRLVRKALKQSKELNEKELIGKSLNMLALFYMIQAEYDESMKLSQKAITYFEELGNELGIADAKYNIASIYYKTDHLHAGLVYLIDCLTIYRTFNNYHQEARTLKALGTIYEYFGDEKRSISTYLECIEASRKANDSNLESNALNPLSGIYLNQGNIERAKKLIEYSITMKKQTGDIRGLAFALYGRGKIYTRTGEFEKAEKDFFDAIDIHVNAGEKLGQGMAFHKLGNLYIQWKKNKKAKEYLSKAASFALEYNIALIKLKCNYLLYELFKKEGDSDTALKYLEVYLEEKEANINTQTLKVIENYEMISKMESDKKEAQMRLEKAAIVEKKNLAENSARVKQEFLSTMSHEIRTPLNAVITISSMLGEGRDVEEQQLLDSLNFSAKNLLYIINDILDFTKLDSGKVTLDFRSYNLKKHLQNICNTYEGLATEKGLLLDLKVDKNLSIAYKLDDTKLSQILGNLITNAIKFTDKGIVTVLVKKVSKVENKDVIHFCVKDTGHGISKEFQKHLFDSFSQSKSIRTRQEGGSGLGLAIVKKIIALYDSEIHVRSTFGSGSEFYFDLKLEPSKKPKEISVDHSEQFVDLTILLAEDNRINAIVLGKLLGKWGINYDHAVNGAEVLEMARDKEYDFILMDIHMPVMDGFEATKAIKSGNNKNQETPIFALTADVTAEQEDEFTQFFDGFLLKPIEKEKLYEVFTNGKVKTL